MSIIGVIAEGIYEVRLCKARREVMDRIRYISDLFSDDAFWDTLTDDQVQTVSNVMESIQSIITTLKEETCDDIETMQESLHLMHVIGDWLDAISGKPIPTSSVKQSLQMKYKMKKLRIGRSIQWKSAIVLRILEKHCNYVRTIPSTARIMQMTSEITDQMREDDTILTKEGIRKLREKNLEFTKLWISFLFDTLKPKKKRGTTHVDAE